MSTNVEYDLNAPLPETDEDAIHDFLFDSKLGFCEQIASSLTIMLRTQGVPARLATGYVSGSRDEVAGVFEVRAADAHAWVEVWFPETGWQAFDPTAAVPLSAEAEIESVGGDLAALAPGGDVAGHVARLGRPVEPVGLAGRRVHLEHAVAGQVSQLDLVDEGVGLLVDLLHLPARVAGPHGGHHALVVGRHGQGGHDRRGAFG